jgi:hypothetical protein
VALPSKTNQRPGFRCALAEAENKPTRRFLKCATEQPRKPGTPLSAPCRNPLPRKKFLGYKLRLSGASGGCFKVFPCASRTHPSASNELTR